MYFVYRYMYKLKTFFSNENVLFDIYDKNLLCQVQYTISWHQCNLSWKKNKTYNFDINNKLILYSYPTNFYIKYFGRLVRISTKSYFFMTSSINWLSTRACSPGIPGRKCGEHMGDNSTLGTIIKKKVLHLIKIKKSWNFWDTYISPMWP